MSRPAYLFPTVEQYEVAVEQGWLWLRAERVREWRTPLTGGTWERWEPQNMPNDPLWQVFKRRHPTCIRERLVSPTIPENLLPKKCPECDGYGRVGDFYNAASFICPACRGRRLVADTWYAGVEQWRTVGTEKWSVYQWEEPRERRQALLAEVRLTGQPIPVVDDLSAVETESYPFIVVDPLTDSVLLWTGPAAEDVIDLLDTDEDTYLGDRWAQGLAPGDLLAPVDVTMLDQPVVDKPCSTCDGRGLGRNRSHDGKPIDVPCWSCGGGGRVPLSLVPGTWETL